MRPSSLTKNQLTIAGSIYAFLLVILYALIYYFELFGSWNRVLLDSITILAALTCAITLTVIVTFYQPGEPPRQIWIYFALALWAWTIGEVIWGGYNLMMGEVPDVTFGDLFYFAGYIFFTLALATQYRLVLFTPGRKIFLIAAGIWIATIALTLIVMIVSQSQSMTSEFLAYFYPIGDFVVGVAALVLVVTFHGGALARPWISLLAFVFSDTLYLWATTREIYVWQDAGGAGANAWITMAVEMVYLVAYMVMFWGVFQQYLTLRFGVAVPQGSARPMQVKQVSQ